MSKFEITICIKKIVEAVDKTEAIENFYDDHYQSGDTFEDYMTNNMIVEQLSK